MLLPAVEDFEGTAFTANIYLRRLLINVPYENANLINTEGYAKNLISVSDGLPGFVIAVACLKDHRHLHQLVLR